MAEKIRVERRRTGSFIVNFPRGSGMVDTYIWFGAKPNYRDVKEIPADVVSWLATQTTTLKDGHLVIAESAKKDPEVKQIDEAVKAEAVDLDENTHTYEEISELLSGQLTNKKKAELEKITTQEEKEFVLQVAKDMKIDSVIKREFIADMLDIPVDIAFDL